MDKNVTAVILIVLAIGVYVTFTSSMWDQIKAVQAVNAQYTQAIANSDKLIKVRDQVLADFNKITLTDQDRLSKMLPSTEDDIRLVIDMNSLALQNGITLQGIGVSSNSGKQANAPKAVVTPGDEGSQLSLDTVGINFSVTAPYAQFINFMRVIESNLRLMDITHLSVAVDETTGAYTWTVSMNTYWLRQ